MEVLQVGMKNVVTCGNCDSQLRWAHSDLRVREDKSICFGPYDVDIEPEDSYRVYVNCAVCKHDVGVSADRSLKRRLITAAKERQDRIDHDI